MKSIHLFNEYMVVFSFCMNIILFQIFNFIIFTFLDIDIKTTKTPKTTLGFEFICIIFFAHTNKHINKIK